ncbi:hypothetical protein [Photorhabdus noenieputensis]|nr:hypothetical protein [Photorhabdus noenieputensis]
MKNTTYQMNEGSLVIPDNWRDESMPFEDGQRDTLLAVVHSFQAA